MVIPWQQWSYYSLALKFRTQFPNSLKFLQISKIVNFIKNVVAVAAYSRLASQSQAKFQTMKLSPLSALQAAAPAQSTISTCSFDFRLARVRMWIWHTLSHWPFPGIFEARNEVSWWLLTSLVSRSQEWAFFHVTFDIKRLLFRLV